MTKQIQTVRELLDNYFPGKPPKQAMEDFEELITQAQQEKE